MEINSELGSGDPALEVPWASPKQPRLKYVDLKKHPEKITSLPECRNHPPLAQFLHRINTSESAFRTAKCGVWVTAELEEDEELDFQQPVKVASYVDLVFERRDHRSHLEPHLRLAKELEKSLAVYRLPAQLDIVLRQCLFHQNRKWGYSLTIFVHAYGATRSQAEEAWGCALNNLGNALLKISSSLIKNRAKQLDPRTRGAI